MKFCDNLRNFRKQKKILQKQLAEKVGVSRQSVSKWECGEAYPEMNHILRLCSIFHCRINDLVHEDFVDIDLLDEEIKMSVVKLRKEQQKKMKGLSKAIYIISRIGKIIMMLGIISVLIPILGVPILGSNIKVENPNEIELFHQKIEYQRSKTEIVIIQEGKTQTIRNLEQVYLLNQMFDQIEEHSVFVVVLFIEIAFLTLGVMLVFLYFTFHHLENLFINIYSWETPFTIDNIYHIKRMAVFMITVIIIPNMIGIIMENIIQKDLGIGFDVFDLIYVLFLFSMSYIFEYGYQIQLDSKGKMYDE